MFRFDKYLLVCREADEICKYLAMDVPEIFFCDVNNGRADLLNNIIIFPQRLLECDKKYLLYYIVHELLHLKLKICEHNNLFKLAEYDVLDNMYGVMPIYKDELSYPICIVDSNIDNPIDRLFDAVAYTIQLNALVE